MKTFLFVWRQDPGLCCDYTIGCGIRTEEKKFLSAEQARAHARDVLAEQSDDDEQTIESVDVYEVADDWKGITR